MHVLGTGSASAARLFACLGVAALAACADRHPAAPFGPPLPAVPVIQAFSCAGTTAGDVSCTPASGSAGGASPTIIGGQGTYVKLTSSNVSFDSGTGIFQFDVTVQNLLNEALGTPDGTLADPDGIRVFFHSGPVVTGGTGTIATWNPDGTGSFTGSNQPYFAYHEILAKNAVSAPRTWQLQITGPVTSFAFTVYVEADVQYLLVINEVLANPGYTISDMAGEWFEIHNAGTLPVDMQDLMFADSSLPGRRPYHRIAASLVVPPGGYVTLGTNTDTTTNGGAPVDYAYPYRAGHGLANSFDAVKIARVYGADTLTIDRVAYSSAGGVISYKNGISRELKNPSLDNSDMDGSNWADADSAAVYGIGGRGTPKAQNSTFTP